MEKKVCDVNEKMVLLKKKFVIEFGELVISINIIVCDVYMEVNLEMEIVFQGLCVLIKDDQNCNMFECGSVKIMLFFKMLLVEFVLVFDLFDNKIIIIGYIDVMVYKNNIYNNWNFLGDCVFLVCWVLEEVGMLEDKVMQVSVMVDQMLLDFKNL